MDTSFASRLAIPGQRNAEAKAIFEDGSSWSAPWILRQEFFNAVRRLENRRIVDRAAADRAIAEFEQLGVHLIDQPKWIERALATSRRFNQSGIFDAIYLACADDLGAELWTYDGSFVRSFGDRRPTNLRFAPEDAPTYLRRSP